MERANLHTSIGPKTYQSIDNVNTRRPPETKGKAKLIKRPIIKKIKNANSLFVFKINNLSGDSKTMYEKFVIVAVGLG